MSDVLAVITLTIFVLGTPPILFSVLSRNRKKTAKRYVLLGDSSTRLEAVLEQLLKRVDELDRLMSFQAHSDIGADKLRVAAGDLVLVSECLPVIKTLLAERRFDESAEMLASTTKVLEKAANLLDQVEQLVNN